MSASATLSVKITGDASSFEKAVSKAQQTCSNLQTRFGGIGKAAQSIGGKLSKFVTAPALAATTALAGMSLSKGFSRLKSIDEAKAKLTGLGNSAEQVKEIMKNANASVKGTAYGLDEAATTAASAVAAGVKPGKELTRYLSLTADAAAASGASMADMGRVINKVQTSQHAYTEEINMLADRGLPIYQWLADECHKSADAVKDMASKGEISSAMFLKAIEKNIGGAAAIIGENSFTGALSNVQASISRIGANFLDAGGEGGGFFSQIKPLLVDLKEALGSVEAISADLGVSFGKMFEPFANSASSALQQFTALDPAMQKSKLSSIALGGAFAASLGPGIKTAGKLAEKASGVFGGMKTSLSTFSSSINKSTQGFKLIGKGTKKMIDECGSAFKRLSKKHIDRDFKKLGEAVFQPFSDLHSKIANSKIGVALSDVGKKAKFVLSSIGQSFSFFGSKISGVFSTIGKGISSKLSPIVGAVKNQFGKVGSALSTFGSNVSTKLAPVTEKFKSAFSSIGLYASNVSAKFAPIGAKISKAFAPMQKSMGGVFNKFSKGFQLVLRSAASFIPGLTKMFAIGAVVAAVVAGLGLLKEKFGDQIDSIIETVKTKAPEIITNFGTKITENLPKLIESGSQLITQILTTISTLLPLIIEQGANIVSSLVSGLAGQLPTLIPAAFSVIVSLVTALLDNLPQIITAGLDLLVGLVTGIVNSIPVLINALPQIITSIVVTLVQNLPQIVAAGLQIIATLVLGLLKAIPQLVAALPQIIDSIKGAFKNEDWKTNGKEILQGVIDGIKAMASELWAEVTKVAKGIAERIKVRFTSSSSGVSADVPQNARGTDNFVGGFTYMNEGGRGELAYLPSGTQIIPHDISVTYAKEAARMNTAQGGTDMADLGEYIVAAVAGSSREYAEQLAHGIAGMRFKLGDRETGRWIASLGFVR